MAPVSGSKHGTHSSAFAQSARTSDAARLFTSGRQSGKHRTGAPVRGSWQLGAAAGSAANSDAGATQRVEGSSQPSRSNWTTDGSGIRLSGTQRPRCSQQYAAGFAVVLGASPFTAQAPLG